jgi:hypothetical protein
MCFSATASFVAATALVPVGLACVQQTLRGASWRTLPLACMPLLFAAQQAIEGVVWLALGGVVPHDALPGATLLYLGFAFALWPMWLPSCCLALLAPDAPPCHRWMLRGLLFAGVLLAAALWLPLLQHPALVQPVIRHGSIAYHMPFPLLGYGGLSLAKVVYVLIICVPLLLTGVAGLRWFSLFIAAAFVLAHLAYSHAFSSVWCYFSALLSLMLFWILRERSFAQAIPFPSVMVRS